MNKADSVERSILVVDDNEATRALIGRILEQELGANVTLSGSAAEGERHLLQSRFDVILLDLLMPGISGFELLRKIRTGTHVNRDTPVIVVSVLGDPDSLRRCRALGATYHVVKPILRESLTRVVSEHLPGGRSAASFRPADAPTAGPTTPGKPDGSGIVR